MGSSLVDAGFQFETLGFHSISFPSEWGAVNFKLWYVREIVSIQLVSPASGESALRFLFKSRVWGWIWVSIQLVSPASGECLGMNSTASVATPISFHSISFPSEWGATRRRTRANWQILCFHSISFPSEWGDLHPILGEGVVQKVSIQLVSPASGEFSHPNLPFKAPKPFPFN